MIICIGSIANSTKVNYFPSKAALKALCAVSEIKHWQKLPTLGNDLGSLRTLCLVLHSVRHSESMSL